MGEKMERIYSSSLIEREDNSEFTKKFEEIWKNTKRVSDSYSNIPTVACKKVYDYLISQGIISSYDKFLEADTKHYGAFDKCTDIKGQYLPKRVVLAFKTFIIDKNNVTNIKVKFAPGFNVFLETEVESSLYNENRQIINLTNEQSDAIKQTFVETYEQYKQHKKQKQIRNLHKPTLKERILGK